MSVATVGGKPMTGTTLESLRKTIDATLTADALNV
jgi:hypothetical protein